jgi:large subunit ribosomal protein L2
MRKTGGRGNMGHVCVRHRGGGHKRRYRYIDFQRSVYDVPGVVQRLEYDPNRSVCDVCATSDRRSARLALTS